MADTTILQLTENTSPSLTDYLVEATAGGINYKVTLARINTLFSTNPIFTGTITTTAADGVYTPKFKATTGMVRFMPYYNASYGAFIDSIDSAEANFLPLSIRGKNIIFFTAPSGGTETFRLAPNQMTFYTTDTTQGVAFLSTTAGLRMYPYYNASYGTIMDFQNVGSSAWTPVAIRASYISLSPGLNTNVGINCLDGDSFMHNCVGLAVYHPTVSGIALACNMGSLYDFNLLYDGSTLFLRRSGASHATAGYLDVLQILTSGQVGMGAYPTDYYLDFDDLVIGGAGHRGITIATTDGGNCTIAFADGTSGAARYMGYLQYLHSTDTLYVGVGGTPVASFATGGAATFVGEAHAPNLQRSAEGQVISGLYSIVTAANIKGFWIFDQTGATSSITDRSGNAHTTTLRNGVLAAINASTCTPGVGGLAPYLTFDSTHMWNTPDHNDFTFVGTAFTIISLINPALDSTQQHVIAKGEPNQNEWYLYFDSANKLTFAAYKLDASAYIGRRYNTSLIGDNGSWNSYIATYDGGTSSSGLKIYRNGTQIDDTDINTGSFTGMTNSTAKVADNYDVSGTPNYIFKGLQSLICVCAGALTAAQVRQVDYLLRAYAGVQI